jgi:hypothetical protein
MMAKQLVPQQYAGQRPPRGWVPPLGQELTLLGVYDNESGFWMGLPLQALREALLTAESLQTEDRIDERDKIELTVLDATDQDIIKTKEFEVPAGEVWYLNRFNSPKPIPWIRNTWELTWLPARMSAMTWPRSDSWERIYD